MRLIDETVRVISTWAGLALTAVMGLVVTTDVVLRALFGTGFRWSFDVTSMALTAFFFVILPLSCRLDGHVRMDIFYLNFRPGLRRVSDRIGLAGAALFFAAIGWEAFGRAPFMREFGMTSPTVGIPLWPLAVFVGICCALALVALLRRAFAGPPPPDQAPPIPESRP